MLPSNWKVEKVGDLFEVQLGKMLNKKAKEINPQFFYLGNTNVKWGHFELSELKKMHFSESEIAKFSLEPNDILMCEGGEVGRCAIWPGSKERIYYQKALHRLRSKGKIVPQFFQNYMESISGTKILDNSSTKTSISHLTREKLIYLPVKLPPLPEQKKIAQILSTWDKAITITEQLFANSQQQKKSLMQQLLTGKKRLLDENGVGFSGDWRNYLLGDFSQITTGTSKSKFISETGHNYIIDMGSVTREGKLFPSKRTDIKSDFLKAGQLVMPKDDIGGGNIIGKVGIIDENNKYILADHVYALKITNHNSLFISYIINSYLVNKSIRRKANGTAQLGLSKKDVSKQNIYMPNDIEEQHKIAAVLSAADKEITVLQQKLDMLKQEKKALMQQLLTGKRRVKVEEAA